MTDPALHGNNKHISFAWFRRLLARTSWTVLDQALLAFANFAGNVVLARWLTPVQYGGFMAASALFWMVLNVYGGLIPEPMMVFGSNRFRDRLSSYFTVLTTFHLGISAVISAGLAVTGFALMLRGSPAPGSSILGYAIACPTLLLLWLARRAVYLRSSPRLAAVAGGIYMVGTLAILDVFYSTATLSSFTAPLAGAGASALAILIVIIAIRPFQIWVPWPRDFMRTVAIAHWHYGRWSVMAAMTSWAPTAVYYLLIMPVWVGLQGNAALNALWNLVMPAIQVGLALSLLLIPAFSRARDEGRASVLMWSALLTMVAGAALYALVIDLAGEPVMDLVYGGRYTQFSHFAWVVGIAALPNAAIAVLESALRAHQRPDIILWAYVASTAVTCVFGPVAVAAWGVLGGTLGLLVRDVTTMLVELWWVRRVVGSSNPQATGRLST